MSTQTLVPNGSTYNTASGKGWTVTGGGTVHAALDDAPPGDTATYVRRTNTKWETGSSWLSLSFSNYTIPAGSVVVRVRVGVYANRPAGGAMAVEYGESVTGKRKRVVWFPVSKATYGATWYYSDWQYTAPSGHRWTQGYLDSVIARIVDYTQEGTTAIALYDVVVQVEVNSPPTTAITAPSGTITSSKPTVTWDYAQADDQGQDKWEVQVVDDATGLTQHYHGWGNGSEPSFKIPVDLPKGEALRFRVRTAFKRGVHTLWSDWDTSVATVDTDMPVAPTVTATWAGSTDSVTLRVDGVTNHLMLQDSTFESTVGGWTATSNCSVARDTTQHYSGVASMRIRSTASGTMTAQSDHAFPPVALADAENFYHYGSARLLRASGTARTIRVGIKWSTGSTTWGSAVTEGVGTWTRAYVNATGAAGATWGALVVEVQSTGGASEDHYVDETQLWHYSGNSAPYAWSPGGYSGGPDASNNHVEAIGIQRTLDGGTTWRDWGSEVYGSEWIELSNLMDTVVIDGDRLVPTTGTITYRARIRATVNGVDGLASPWSSTVNVTAANTKGWSMRGALATNPNALSVNVVEADGFEIQTPTGVFVPISGDPSVTAYPVITQGRPSPRSGTIVVQTLNAQQWADLQAMLALSNVWLQTPFGDGLFMRFMSHTVVRDGTALDPHRRVTISWIETRGY